MLGLTAEFLADLSTCRSWEAPMIGRRLLLYDVLEKRREGGMEAVYRPATPTWTSAECRGTHVQDGRG